MISSLKCLKHTPVKIFQNNIKSLSHFRFPAAITDFDLKNNVLFNKFKEWYTYFSGPNEAKHLKEILIKQQHLQQMQDERREIGKLLTDVRKIFIEKQDRIFKLNKWENVDEYVLLRKEEAELMKKEYELTAKFEELDKIEKDFFVMLNKTVHGSYEREKTKKFYAKYLGVILTVVIIMLSGVFTRITNIEENYEKRQYFTGDDLIIIQSNESAILVAIGIAVMLMICRCCC